MKPLHFIGQALRKERNKDSFSFQQQLMSFKSVTSFAPFNATKDHISNQTANCG